jgi:hypothetical protein
VSEKQIVHLSDQESKHWVEKFLYARDKMYEYKNMMDEAKEVWLSIVGDDWDMVEVDGTPVFENVKTSPNRFSVAELKKKYPEIYREFLHESPQSSVKVLR